MFDSFLRTTLKNFSTFFLIVAMVALPLFLGHAFWFRDVVATESIHDAISGLPEGEKVRGVGPDDLDAARIALGAVWVALLAALPALVRATARALEADRAGEVPTAIGAWRGIARKPRRNQRPPAVALAGCLGLAALVWWAALRIGLLLAEPLGASLAWMGVGLAWGLAAALGLPWVLVPLAAGRVRAESGPEAPPEEAGS